MMATYLVVDSGTTNTRVRLWHNHEITRTFTTEVGARNVAVSGSSEELQAALAHLIREARSAAPADVDAVICSGMITSNVGLLEIPHLAAPAGKTELAAGVVRRDLPKVTDLPLYFVPGIKTLAEEFSWETLAEYDVMRGEEVECLGLQRLLQLASPASYFHCGSHHKLIGQDEQGRLSHSRTGITGELLSAVQEHTILKSSTQPISAAQLQQDAWRAGLACAQHHGLARALFLVRVGEQLGQFGKGHMTSFMLGAMLSLDLRLLDQELAKQHPLVLYGKGFFPEMLHEYLTERGFNRVIRASHEQSEQAAVVGAVDVVHLHLQTAAKA